MSSARIARLVEQETIDGAAAYRPLDFLADVRKGIWSEAYGTAPVKIDAYRRNLQRAYVETLADRINGRQAAVDDARAFFRGELKTLDTDLRAAAPEATDRDDAAASRGRADADRPRARPGRPGERSRSRRRTGADAALDLDVSVDPVACWVDYAIRGEAGSSGQLGQLRPASARHEKGPASLSQAGPCS